MSTLWYFILAFMLITYVVLDGRNFGAGVLHFVVAKTPRERRQIIAAIGPLWSWHEVWLVGTGGVMLMAFPRFMAAAFSGYYLALFLVLWCIILRGISIEVGGHMDDALWQSFWNGVFTLSNVLLAVLFGAAFGNVVRGVPLAADGTFHLTFFTNFRVQGQVGLLDWYSLAVALFATLVLTAHGATYLVMRTEGPVHERSRAVARRTWAASALAFVAISLLTQTVRPELLDVVSARPLVWVPAAFSLGSALVLTESLHRGREQRALVASSALIFGVLATGAAALFPILLFSTLNPADSLTAGSCAAPDRSLQIATMWWFPALALALSYLWVVQRHYSGKVNVQKDDQGLY